MRLLTHCWVQSNACWILALLSGLVASSAAEVAALTRAHAHNDYEHTRPLLDALSHGFSSVEADIYLVDGQLLVAHHPADLKPERTLEKLYLDPLRERVREHNGQVYPKGESFLLLVDIKTEAEPTYRALMERLAAYSSMLTRYRADQTTRGAVTIILSGNRPTALVAAQAERLVAIDGRLPDLDSNASVHLIPLVSDSWSVHFRWRGQGPISPEDQTKLREVVQRAHDQKRRVRFWATPDLPGAWKVLLEAGVDLINTDDLSGLERFLRAQ